MWTGVGYDFYNDDATIEPDDHGTHVAGTVAAVNNNGAGVSGIAGGSGSNDGVRLMSCQVFTPAGGSGSGFHLAPIYAADNGACISQNSWTYGSPNSYSQAVLDAIDYFNTNGGGSALLNGGITIFGAANFNSSDHFYPAYYSGTFSVAATNNQDVKSYYSNFGTWVDVSAPGGETNAILQRGVLSTISDDAYDFYQGTSMAAPHSSGVAALIVSLAFGSLTPANIADIIRNTTDDHYVVNPDYAGQLGTGRLNAYRALLETQDYISGIFNPQTFIATPVSTNQINLEWTKNTANQDVMILGSLSSTIGKPADGIAYTTGQAIPGGGIVLYRGGNTSVTQPNLNAATTYYFMAFSYNPDNAYSSGKSANATTFCDPVSTLPWIEGFENVGSVTTFNSDLSSINGLCGWSYDMVTGGGRLRFEAGSDFYFGGTKAATLDRSSTGPDNVNYLIAELDLTNYSGSGDLELSFYYMDHGEEAHLNDRVWIRGNNTDPWIEIYDLVSNQGTAGYWNSVSELDLDASLAAAVPPQTVSSTFQIRYGQEDNSSANSTAEMAGYTFDDISISGSFHLYWTGAISANWDNPGNWDKNVVPAAGVHVIIPASANTWPVKTGDIILGTSCGNIIMEGSSKLTVTGSLSIPSGKSFTCNTDAVIYLGGDWINLGEFEPGTGTVVFAGNSNSDIDVATVADNSLQTTFSGGNGSNGNMFDIIAINEIIITSFDGNLIAGTRDIHIYYKSGTYAGYESNAAAWTFVGTESVTSFGAGSSTPIPIPLNVTIPAGQRYAFYIHTEDLKYTNGTAAGNVYASDANLQFLEGCGKGGDLFSLFTFPTRIFNGVIYYTYPFAGSVTYNNLVINKSNAEVQNNGALAVDGNLTIKPGAWFTNGLDKTITITNDVWLEADAGAMASYIDNGSTSVTGVTYVEQYLSYSPPFQYHAISSPISDATINTYYGMFLYEYDEPTNGFVNLSVPATLPLDTGKGYYVTGSEQYIGVATITFETTPPAGVLNTGDVTLTDFTREGPDPQFRGFRLVGNPWPCALHWNENWTMSGLSGWMVFIDNGSYRGYHPTQGPFNGGTDIIPSTQGFWVRALNNNASLTIPASERIHSSQGFHKEQKAYTNPGIRLEVESNGQHDEAVVVFHPEGHIGFDGYYDLAKFTNPEGVPQLYTVSEGMKYAFNVLSEEYVDVIVPLYFEIISQGLYQLKATAIDNMAEEIKVYLEDLKEGTITDLKSDPEYEFSYDQSDEPHRFNLHFKNSWYGTENVLQNSIRIYSYANRIYIQTPFQQQGKVLVYDILGKKLISIRINETGQTIIPVTSGTGYYLVKVQVDNKVKTEKVFIK